MWRTRQFSVKQAQQRWPAAWDSICEIAIAAITLPYYLLYDRNTRSHIVAIVKAEHPSDILPLLHRWLNTKYKEAQYVQVAGAVMFASTIGSLSWADVTDRHWTASACWYTSIIFALTAVVSGAQQSMLMESLQLAPLESVRNRLRKKDNRISHVAVFAWQVPLMFLSYALLFFVGGLTSYVATPVARHRTWDNSSKTLLFYTLTTTFAFVVFVGSSRLVHHTLPTSKEPIPPQNTVPYLRQGLSVDYQNTSNFVQLR